MIRSYRYGIWKWLTAKLIKDLALKIRNNTLDQPQGMSAKMAANGIRTHARTSQLNIGTNGSGNRFAIGTACLTADWESNWHSLAYEWACSGFSSVDFNIIKKDFGLLRKIVYTFQFRFYTNCVHSFLIFSIIYFSEMDGVFIEVSIPSFKQTHIRRNLCRKSVSFRCFVWKKDTKSVSYYRVVLDIIIHILSSQITRLLLTLQMWKSLLHILSS